MSERIVNVVSVEQLQRISDMIEGAHTRTEVAVASLIAEGAETMDRVGSLTGIRALGREPRAAHPAGEWEADPPGLYRVGSQDVQWDGAAETGRTEALATAASVAQAVAGLKNRGAVYVPDLLSGSSGPVENMTRLNAALGEHRDRREFYFPAEYGVYEFAHENPASGASGIFYESGQTLRGDGAATVLRYADRNALYGHLMLPRLRAGERHEHARLLDFTLDHNATEHLPATVTLGLSQTHYTHVRLTWRNIPLVACFADSPEESPTVGAVIENPQVFKSLGVALSFFNACKDFQIIGAGRFEDLVDDGIAFQEGGTGFQSGHTAVGTLVFRRCGGRHYVPGEHAGYSTPVAVRLIGCESVNWQALVDADGMAGAVLHCMGTQAMTGFPKYEGGRKNRDITIGPIHGRRTGRDTPTIEGHPNPANALIIEDSLGVSVSGGVLSDSVGNGVGIINSQRVVVRNAVSRGGAVGLRATAGSTVRVEGGDYGANQAGILAEDAGTWVEVHGVYASDNQYPLYAARGALITGHNVLAAGGAILQRTVEADGGQVIVSGIRHGPGPLDESGEAILPPGAVVLHVKHRLRQSPRVVEAHAYDTFVAAFMYSHGDPGTFTLRLAAPVDYPVRVRWTARL